MLIKDNIPKIQDIVLYISSLLLISEANINFEGELCILTKVHIIKFNMNNKHKDITNLLFITF
jgi:hypothetical protein